MTDENEEQSLEQTLEAAYEKHTAEPAQVDTPDAEAPAVEKPVTEDRTDGRDEKGKFKAKAEEVLRPVVAAKKAPIAWSKERQEKFNALPPDVQDAIIERESEVEKGFTKLDEDRNFGKSLKEVITPYMATIQAEGGTPQGAVRDLLNTAFILRTGSPQQKASIVQQVIKQYGVDPRLFGAQPSAGQGQQQQIPALNKDDIKREIMTELQSSDDKKTVAAEYKAFTENVKNVHFSNPAVKDKMSSLLGSSAEPSFQDAYDQAIWLVPELRPALIAASTPPAAQRTTDIAAKKKAGSSVSGSPGITVPNSGNPDRTLEEELEASWNAAMH